LEKFQEMNQEWKDWVKKKGSYDEFFSKYPPAPHFVGKKAYSNRNRLAPRNHQKESAEDGDGMAMEGDDEQPEERQRVCDEDTSDGTQSSSPLTTERVISVS
jgi:hypothetical protein